MAKFIDSVDVIFKAGNGGNGIVSFHREKFVDKGGPSGGDGGRGGSIFLVGDSNKSTLYDFKFKNKVTTENGSNGGSSMKHGKDGEDLYVGVPLGTIIRRRDQEIIGEITKNGQIILLSRGGTGGRGNAKFKSSVNTVPRLSENGMEGQEVETNLELKILADVALVGYPSVGKSTIISMITNVKPKIADYEFTTLIPNIGVSYYGENSFVVADIPGLIEGASKGKGLGHQFLKHIERCKFILHILDSTDDILEIERKHKVINNELAFFSSKLSNLEQALIFNKIDEIDEDKLDALKSKYKNANFVSSFDNKNMEKVREICFKNISRINESKVETTDFLKKDFKYYNFDSKIKEIEILKINEETYEVRGSLVDYWSRRIPMISDQNYSRFRQKLVSNGIFKLLEKKGWKEGYIVEIAINGEIYEFK